MKRVPAGMSLLVTLPSEPYSGCVVGVTLPPDESSAMKVRGVQREKLVTLPLATLFT